MLLLREYGPDPSLRTNKLVTAPEQPSLSRPDIEVYCPRLLRPPREGTMSPEELNRKLEFIVEYQAEFAIRQDRDHEMLVRGFDALTRRIGDLRESTARFQSDASRLVIIQSG